MIIVGKHHKPLAEVRFDAAFETRDFSPLRPRREKRQWAKAALLVSSRGIPIQFSFPTEIIENQLLDMRKHLGKIQELLQTYI
jgi:hypothetical protein